MGEWGRKGKKLIRYKIRRGFFGGCRGKKAEDRDRGASKNKMACFHKEAK